MYDLYNFQVRSSNKQSRSLSPKNTLSERLSWGSNSKSIQSYAANKLREVCLGMRRLQRSCSLQKERDELRYTDNVPPENSKNMTSEQSQKSIEDKENKAPEQKVQLDSAIKIQRFFRQRQRRKQLLEVLHLKYRPKPKLVETAVNTDPITFNHPPIKEQVAPKSDTESIAALKSK